MACGHGMLWCGRVRVASASGHRAAPGLVRLAWRLDFLVRNLAEHCHMIRRTRTPSGHISGNRQRALLRELMPVEHLHLQLTGLNAGRTGRRQHKGIYNPCIRAAHRLAAEFGSTEYRLLIDVVRYK
jgi:hypothetical protein